MDVETFLKETRGSVANFITKQLQDLDSAKVQTTTWIQFEVKVEDGSIIIVDTVRKLFNSWMMEVFQGSDFGEITKKMFAHMKMQVENPALTNSRYVFDRVLFLDINFHQLNLTRGCSYLPLPDWISSKKVVINPKNEKDGTCFKWAILAALHHENIDSHPERISNLRRFEGNYDSRGLRFPIALSKISIFEQNKTS